MNFLERHADTIATIATILTVVSSSVLWMNGKFCEIDKRFNKIELDLCTIKTVLITKGIMSDSLTKHEEK